MNEATENVSNSANVVSEEISFELIQKMIKNGELTLPFFKYNYQFEEKGFINPLTELTDKVSVAFQNANNLITKLNGNKLNRRQDPLILVNDSIDKIPYLKLTPLCSKDYPELFSEIENDTVSTATNEEEKAILELKKNCLSSDSAEVKEAVISRIIRKEPNGEINKHLEETFLYELDNIILEIGTRENTDLNILFSGKELKQLLVSNQ